MATASRLALQPSCDVVVVLQVDRRTRETDQPGSAEPHGQWSCGAGDLRCGRRWCPLADDHHITLEAEENASGPRTTGCPAWPPSTDDRADHRAREQAASARYPTAVLGITTPVTRRCRNRRCSRPEVDLAGRARTPCHRERRCGGQVEQFRPLNGGNRSGFGRITHDGTIRPRWRKSPRVSPGTLVVADDSRCPRRACGLVPAWRPLRAGLVGWSLVPLHLRASWALSPCRHSGRGDQLDHLVGVTSARGPVHHGAEVKTRCRRPLEDSLRFCC